MLDRKVKILGIIPARYGSTRLPGKPLMMIDGRSMVERVYIAGLECKSLSKVIVATDHPDIYNHIVSAKGNSVMTGWNASGTDRCQEAYESLGETYDYVINIQGDMPFIPSEIIDQVAELCDGETEIATLVKRIENREEMKNPNIVKVITHLNGECARFSRRPINNLKHIGIYAYRSDVLKKIASLPQTKRENSERLEQLRWLENGYKIISSETLLDSPSIDTPEDYENICRNLRS